MNIFCKVCGYPNRDTAKFCQGCGGKISGSAQKGTLQPGIILDKRYEIKRLVKSGGMGAVYEALDHRFEKQSCALKEMLCLSTDPAEREYMIGRFKEEARMLRNLRHPHMPGVIDYFVEAGRYYLVMDYVKGEDLQSVMEGYGEKGVPEHLVIDWAIQVLEVLEYLHNQSPPIIYRDLKPANIMLESTQRKIMLIDFGIARTINPASSALKTGIGTPAYAPQELFMGQAEPRTDLYSLGATMHSLLTGRVPSALFSFEPVRKFNPLVSENLESIIMHALEADMDRRFQNAGEMKRAINLMAESNLSSPLPSSSSDATALPDNLDAETPTLDMSTSSQKTPSPQVMEERPEGRPCNGMSWYLEVLCEKGQGKEYPISSELRIGRSLECDISLQDNRVSARHALIKPEKSGCMIVDLGSRNGTYINGQLINKSAYLSPGDRITAGETTIIVKGITQSPKVHRTEKREIEIPLFCLHCNAPVSSMSGFCGNCGKNPGKVQVEVSPSPPPSAGLPEAFCTRCSITLSPGAIFCRKCGGKIDERLKSSPPLQSPTGISCPKCGSFNKLIANFCGACGCKL